jgi:hypothetical protein
MTGWVASAANCLPRMARSACATGCDTINELQKGNAGKKAGAVVLSNAKDLPFALSAADPSSLQRLLMLTRHQSANGKL